MSTHQQDRGLTAVRRVRSARETDSRIGLQRALAAHLADAGVVADSRRRIAARPGFVQGSSAAFLADRALLAAMALRIDEQERQADASAVSKGRRSRLSSPSTRSRRLSRAVAPMLRRDGAPNNPLSRRCGEGPEASAAWAPPPERDRS